MATGTASLLRKVGAYGILARLHRSKLIKRVLFNSNVKDESGGLRSKLPTEVVETLDAQIESLKTLYPSLRQLW